MFNGMALDRAAAALIVDLLEATKITKTLGPYWHGIQL
jgi:hypothetical protein